LQKLAVGPLAPVFRFNGFAKSHEKIKPAYFSPPLLGGLGATLASGAAAQPYGPGHPPPWLRPDGSGQAPRGTLPGLESQNVEEASRVAHIDVHMHLVGGRQKLFVEALENCVAAMEQFKITRAIVMGPPQPPPGNVDAPDFLPELRRYGNGFAFLGGGGILNPMLHAAGDPASVTPEIKQQFIDAANKLLDQVAVGFGEIAVLHLSLLNTHPFEQVPTAHSLMAALAEVADQRKVVIDLHMDAVPVAPTMQTPPGLKVPPNPPTLNGNIAGFERLLIEHPSARIVWAHGGSDFTGNLTPALVGRLMDAHANLFMSLRPVPPQVNSVNPLGLHFYNLNLTPSGIEPSWLALLHRHSDRFVMGSDCFFVSSSANPGGAPAMLGRGNQGRLAAAVEMLSKLPPRLQAKIATENVGRIYQI
jgi:hypothetical protein